jgi:hypothetical protein
MENATKCDDTGTVESAGKVVVVVTRRLFFLSLDIAWNDPRHGPCHSRHARGRYHSLLRPAFLDDGLIRRDRGVPYDLLLTIPHWAQPPEGAQILSQKKLRGSAVSKHAEIS